MKVVVTGADGFLGWHARCALRARGDESVAIVRSSTPDEVCAAVRDADLVVHAAGVNRAGPDVLVRDNLSAAQALTAALDRSGSRAAIVHANSIHCGGPTPFGAGKQAAAEHLHEWGERSGRPVADVRLPNLFGEHGRPHYNSFVATFCHELATGATPAVHDDRELPLLHVQDAVDVLLNNPGAATGTVRPEGRPVKISAVLDVLREFRDLYATGDVPDIADPFRLALFNTYRSYCFPAHFPIRPPLRADERGHLFECVKGHGGQAQVFCSTSHPGITRGQHFHLRKVERFLVLRGRAEIALRRLFDHEIVRFAVSGDEPAIVDMPTMWAHSITNTGPDELMTLFWANEVLDPARPDTIPEPV